MTIYTDMETMRAAASAARSMRRLTKRDIHLGGPEIRYRSYERASQDRQGTATSVDQQYAGNVKCGEDYGWTRIGGRYTDNDKTASQRAKAGSREAWERLLRDLAEDPGDVLRFFEFARGTRDLRVYVELRDFCVENGPYFWSIASAIYDVRDADDRQILTALASKAESGSDSIKHHVRPAMLREADKGRPHGQTPYGYRRAYGGPKHKVIAQEIDTSRYISVCDPETGELLGVEVDGHGRPDSWSPQEIVQRIFNDFTAGLSMRNLVEELNGRGIPSPRRFAAFQSGDRERVEKTNDSRWRSSSLRFILRNHHYHGVRMRDDLLASEETLWKPLVSKELFFVAQQRLLDGAQSGERPTRAQTLLTCLAHCYCGARAVYNRNRLLYICDSGGHAAVLAVAANEFVEERVFNYFSDPDVAKRFVLDDGAEANEAREKAEGITKKLAFWKSRALDEDRPDVTEEDYEKKAATLLPELKRLNGIAARTGVPRVVEEMLRGDAEDRWKSFRLEQQRELLKLIWRIEIYPAGKGRRRIPVPMRERIKMIELF